MNLLTKLGRSMAVRAAALVFATAVIAPVAEAQFGRGGMGMWRRMMEPSVTSTQLERYEKFFAMNEEQSATARDLLTGYQGEHQTVAAELRKTIDQAREEIRQSGDPSMWRELGPVMEDYQAKMTKLENTFLEDFKLTLNEDQAAKWEAFERMRRRDTTLDQGGLVSGETVDLIRIVEEAKIPAEAMPPVQPLLEQYELELDKALVERNDIYEKGMSRGMEMWQNQDMQGMQDAFEKARGAAVKVRDVNRRFARQIEAQLPEGDVRAGFAKLFKERSFPRVYGDSFVVNAIETAEGLETIESAQKDQLTQVRASYEREVAAVNDKLAKAIEDNELNRSAMSMMGMGGGNDETRELRDERRKLDEDFYSKVLAVLTEEQRKEMPERPSGDWRRGGRGRFGGEDGQRGG